MLTRFLQAVFWLCFVLTGYVYLIYPLMVSRISRLAGGGVHRRESTPGVTLVISA